MTQPSIAHVTTNDSLARDLRASLHQLRLQKVADLLRDVDVTDDRTRAAHAAKLAINSVDPDVFDAALVKAAEVLHEQLMATEPWREAPLYERAFALSLATKVVKAALDVWQELTPPAAVAQAIADLTDHKAGLTEYGRQAVMLGVGRGR